MYKPLAVFDPYFFKADMYHQFSGLSDWSHTQPSHLLLVRYNLFALFYFATDERASKSPHRDIVIGLSVGANGGRRISIHQDHNITLTKNCICFT